MCIDLKDFYLGTPMNWYKYMWIKMSDIPQDIIDQYGLTDKADAQHLLTCLEKLYKCTTDWEGKLYLGMNLNWNYTERWMEKSMPGYINKVWTRFYGANVAPKRVEAPHVWTAPQYGSSQPQLTTPLD